MMIPIKQAGYNSSVIYKIFISHHPQFRNFLHHDITNLQCYIKSTHSFVGQGFDKVFSLHQIGSVQAIDEPIYTSYNWLLISTI